MSRASEMKAMGETLSMYPLMRTRRVSGFLECNAYWVRKMGDCGVLQRIDIGLGNRAEWRYDPLSVVQFRLQESGDDPALAESLMGEAYRRLRDEEPTPDLSPLHEDIVDDLTRVLIGGGLAGYVYLIASTEGPRRVKIGYSVDPEKRLEQLQASSPVALEIVATYESTMEVEAKLHRRLDVHRLHGEWFHGTAIEPARRFMGENASNE